MVRVHNYIQCGMGLSPPNTSLWCNTGFDADFCKAISAAIFDGRTDSIEYIPALAPFSYLAEGSVDVLSRLTTVTLSSDILEPITGVGFSFSQPIFYDGLTFGGIPKFAECADDLKVSTPFCSDLLICVVEGTTYERRLKTLFPDRYIIPRKSLEFSVKGLGAGTCNVIAGGVADVSSTTVRQAGYQGSYDTGRSRHSKDPLALVTREDDVKWSNFVFWIVSSIFYAEEAGITSETATDMPWTSLFGPDYAFMFQNAVGAVGNYGEIYERHAQKEIERAGLNDLYDVSSSEPLHYPLDMEFME
jgi:general L-amino acid transport system substrate-binding protein